MTLDTTPKKNNEIHSINHSKQQYGNNIRISVAANQGGRKYMEDRVQIETFRNKDGVVLFTFLGVYDGHGGCEASEYVRKHLMNNIMNQELFFSEDDDDILESIKLGFLETHQQMWKVVESWPRTASGYSSTAGTTASVAVIRGGKLYTGHVGDSAIILGKRDNKTSTLVPERLTIDHKPESEDEQARIQMSGGQVMMKSGVNRVVWTRPLRGHTGPIRRSTPTENIPFLAVARSLGDLWSYCEATKEFIVSPEPDMSVRELTENDCFLVLASDGLTNVITPQDVIYIVDEDEELTKKNFSGRKTDYITREKNTNHARSLLGAALKNWRSFRADNISAIVAIFDPISINNDDDDVASVEERLITEHSIDEVFCVDPECMIRVSPSCTQKLATYRTPLLYQGALDTNFSSVSYRGPGFLTHEEEKQLEDRYAQEEFGNQKSKDADELKEDESSPVKITPEKAKEVSPSLRLSRSAKRSTPISLFDRDKLRNSAKRVRSALDACGTRSDACVKENRMESDEENMTCVIDADSSILTTPERRASRRLTTTVNKHVSTKQSKPATRGNKVSLNTDPFYSMNDDEDLSVAMKTRSKDRQNGTPLASPKTPIHAYKTPNCRIPLSAKGSRKRPHHISEMSSGTTPLVSRLTIESPSISSGTPKMRSAPTTPIKNTVPSELLGSKWSLSKLDELKSTIREDEPPSKIRRIYGFVRRLVGLASTQS